MATLHTHLAPVTTLRTRLAPMTLLIMTHHLTL